MSRRLTVLPLPSKPTTMKPTGMGFACGHSAMSRHHLVCEARFGWPSSGGQDKSTRTAAGRKAPTTTLSPPVNKAEARDDVTIVKPTPPLLPIPVSLPSQVQQMSEFASQLVTSFTWPNLSPLPSGQPQQAVESGSKRVDRTQVPDIAECLQTSVSVFELKQMRKLAHLTGLTYKMATVTPRALRRKHALDLVTTSWACEIRGYEHVPTAEEVLEDGDGMAVSVTAAKSTYSTLMGKPTTSGIQPSPGAALAILPVASTAAAQSAQATNTQQPQSGSPAQPPQQAQQQEQSAQQQQPASPSKRWTSPAEMVAGMIGDAAAAATAAAATPLASAAGTIYAGLASLPIASALGAGPRSSAPAAAAALMAAAAQAVASNENAQGGQRDVAARLAAAAGPAAIAAAPGSGTRLAALVQSSTGSSACPSEWFVCDDPAISTRYFVIQGSDTIDHWKLNLTFDPVPFEDVSLGIKVHRGAYEAAQILYERFLPMVYEHLDSSPFAKICFTGHSIGGSLATLLMMMYYHRGVLPASSTANVYTFGAPAIFCVDPGAPRASVHNHHWHHHSYNNVVPKPLISLDGAEPLEAPLRSTPILPSPSQQASTNASSGVRACACGQEGASPLAAVGLPDSIVRNVIMARDIVPRAFACDYSLVADILKGWGPAYKQHAGLAHHEHKHIYFFTGRTMVMQPDSWHWFARPEPDHPMLPPGPDLYLLDTPSQHHRLSVKQRKPTSTATQDATTPMTPAGATTTHVSASGEQKVHVIGLVSGAGNPLDVIPALNGSSSNGNGNGQAMHSVNGHAGSSATDAGAGAAAYGSSKKEKAAAAAPSHLKLQTAQAALWALMDTPHPLDTLTDPGAYLEKGSISRYHNPDNYTAALGRLIYLKRVQEGRIPSWVNHAYSRSLGMEARAEAGLGEATLSTWDSSDGDMWMPVMPVMADPSLAALADAAPEEVELRDGEEEGGDMEEVETWRNVAW